MKLYSQNEYYKLYQGNMLDMLDDIEENSIDSIVTDPPYELGFMNKSWDSAGVSFQKETWEKCLKVLKPGGYLLCFGGSRTSHRIACAIEDAGFEIRDTIMWIFGCYSADTQVLTNEGWKYFYELDKTEKILQWNKDTNKLSWVKPLNYFEYDVDTEMYLFENRHISQLVTPNHKIAVSVKERRKDFTDYKLIEAQDVKKSWILNFPLAGELDGTIHEKDAYLIGWWLTDAWKHNDGKACMFSQSKPKTLSKLKQYLDNNNIKYSEYIKNYKEEKHRNEHIFYVTGVIADKLLKQYPDRKLTWSVLNWDKESRMSLLEGLMDGDGSYRDNEYSMTFWSHDIERCDIVQALCISLNYRAYIYTKNGVVSGVVFNVAHNSTQTQTRHHKANVPYTGKVYCLETETGAFVIRRDGKAFISGNSGFPKSMNIGLAIDKKLGVESETVGVNQDILIKQKRDLETGHRKIVDSYNSGAEDRNNGFKNISADIKEPVSDIGKQFKGWGTALKPSFEPVIIARKPFKGSLVDNVIKYGVGGVNIDECRVETSDDIKNHSRSKESAISKGIYGNSTEQDTYKTDGQLLGRFPANTILTYDETDFDEVCDGLPYTKSTGGSGEKSISGGLSGKVYQGGWSHDKICSHLGGLGDSGSAARYFYCAKASKRDRNDGCENINNHPTVKPVSLMSYLVRLVSPKGSVILDPFNGSGSTGKAVMYENKDRNTNYKYIGIELSEDYLQISKERIDFVINEK